MTRNASSQVHHYGNAFCLSVLLVIVFVLPSHAATPTGLDVVSKILWSGAVTVKGYGHFKWGDQPAASMDVKCPTAEKDFYGVASRSECTATKGLPYVGPFRATAAKYHFKWDHLSEIEIDLEIPSGSQMLVDLPKRVTVDTGQISTKFVSDNKGYATLTMTNTDMGALRFFSELAYSDMDKKAPDALIQFHAKLAQECPKCEAVLYDFEQVISPDKPITVDDAKNLMQNSPQITFLMTLASMIDRKDAFYQMALDKMRISSGALRSSIVFGNDD